MRNVNASNFRKNLFTYMNQALDFNDVINVNTKKGNIIIMSEEDYNSIIETDYLLSNPEVREKLLKGMKAERKDLVKIDWREE